MAEESKHSLSDQIKIAERDKLLAEVRKTEAEIVKIEFDNREARDISNNWLKGEFGKRLIITALLSVLLGLPLLAFYINYAVVPMLEHDKKILIRQNDAILDTIERAQKKLIEDEMELRKRKDSINVARFEIVQQASKIRQMIDSIRSIEDKYKRLNMAYLNSQKSNLDRVKYSQQIHTIQQQINEQNTSLDTMLSVNYTLMKDGLLGSYFGAVTIHPSFEGRFIPGIVVKFYSTSSHKTVFSQKIENYTVISTFPPDKYSVTIEDSRYEAVDKNIMFTLTKGTLQFLKIKLKLK